MNTKLLLKVKEAILAEPRSFNMASYGYKEPNEPECGTICCIAGRALALSGINPESLLSYHASTRAMELLEISSTQRDVLFHTCYWPDTFQAEYTKLKRQGMRMRRTPAMAELAARRIDHFIATGG